MNSFHIGLQKLSVIFSVLINNFFINIKAIFQEAATIAYVGINSDCL